MKPTLLILAAGIFGIDVPDGTPRSILGEKVCLLRNIQNLLTFLT
jgi:hypothetical protein